VALQYHWSAKDAEYRFRHRDGHYIWTQDTFTVTHDKDGKPKEIVGSWADAISPSHTTGVQTCNHRRSRLFSPRVVHGEGLAQMARSHVRQTDCSLASVAIFAGLPEKALERVQQHCSWRSYEPGKSIVGYLDSSDDVFFSSRRGAGNHLLPSRQGGEL
jgi:hypothetical protein